jgi:hypothetical protein
MRFPHYQRDRHLSRFFILFALLALTACQAAPIPTATATPLPTETPVPTPTPAGPPGVLWVDTTKDLGAISPYTLGGNHGPWSDFSLDAFEKTIELGITFIRWPGGAWSDGNDIRSTQIDFYMAQVQKIGATPSITVRVPNGSPEKAAEVVRYVNVKMGYGVKYWNIGNEPNLYDNDPNFNVEEKWTPERYAKVWREFAIAMEAVDPTILFYGPDISQFVGDPNTTNPSEGDAQAYLREFLKVNGDMVDIVTVHRYPFPSCQTCGSPTWEDMRANTPEWENTLPNLRRIIKEVTGKDLPVGVTEYNSHYSANVGTETSPDSFYSALWLADVYGRLLRNKPELLAFWLLKDNNGGLGMLTSFDIRPSYYTFTMWKKFGNHLLATNSDTQFVSVFAAKRDDGSVTVMLVNLGDAVTKPLQLGGGDALQIQEAYFFDRDTKAEALTPPTFTNGNDITLPKESVTLLIFK